MTIESPCVSVCEVDTGTDQCLGCGRTLDEIAAWTTMSAPERRRIMTELPARLDEVSSLRSLGTTSAQVTCPYCNERYELVVDPSIEHQSYVEDCYVCCQPIVFDVLAGDDGVSVTASTENS